MSAPAFRTPPHKENFLRFLQEDHQRLLEYYDHNLCTPGLAIGSDQDLMEKDHNYIQWLFPLPETSPNNLVAPVLTAEECGQLSQEHGVKNKMFQSFFLFNKFLGIECKQRENGSLVIEKTNSDRWNSWLANTHNTRRITRYIRSLALFGLRDEAQALIEFFLKENQRSAPEGNFHQLPDHYKASCRDFWVTGRHGNQRGLDDDQTDVVVKRLTLEVIQRLPQLNPNPAEWWLEEQWQNHKRHDDNTVMAVATNRPLLIFPRGHIDNSRNQGGDPQQDQNTAINQYTEFVRTLPEDLRGSPKRELYVARNHGNRHWDFSAIDCANGTVRETIRNGGGGEDACGAYTLVGIVARSPSICHSPQVNEILGKMLSSSYRDSALRLIQSIHQRVPDGQGQFKNAQPNESLPAEELPPQDVRAFTAFAMCYKIKTNDRRVREVLTKGFNLENEHLEIACDGLGISHLTLHNLTPPTDRNQFVQNILHGPGGLFNERSGEKGVAFNSYCTQLGADPAQARQLLERNYPAVKQQPIGAAHFPAASLDHAHQPQEHAPKAERKTPTTEAPGAIGVGRYGTPYVVLGKEPIVREVFQHDHAINNPSKTTTDTRDRVFLPDNSLWHRKPYTLQSDRSYTVNDLALKTDAARQEVGKYYLQDQGKRTTFLERQPDGSFLQKERNNSQAAQQRREESVQRLFNIDVNTIEPTVRIPSTAVTVLSMAALQQTLPRQQTVRGQGSGGMGRDWL